MLNTSLKILVLAGLLLLGGCGDNGVDYFPLEPGTRWRYSVERTTMDGINEQKFVVQAATPRVWQDERLPVRISLDGTLLYYKKNEQGVFRMAGQHRFDLKPVAIAEDRRMVLKQPLKVGTHWKESSATIVLARTGPPQRSEYEITAPVTIRYVIEAADDTVTVPAGRFENCLRIHGQGRQSDYDAGNYIDRTDITVEQTDWYAPGVGLVKSVRKESTTSKVLNWGSMQTFAGQIVFELEAFEHG